MARALCLFLRLTILQETLSFSFRRLSSDNAPFEFTDHDAPTFIYFYTDAVMIVEFYGVKVVLVLFLEYLYTAINISA